MILIKDGRVVDPETGLDETLDLIIEDGRIKEIGKFSESESYEKIISAKGKIVAPGLVDIHVHFRDPGFTYKEDVETGARSAAAGGYTTVVCMANTKPVIDNVEVLKELEKREETLPIHVYNTAAVTMGLKGKELTDMPELLKAGAIGFTDDGIPIKDEKLVMEAMKTAAQLDVPISFHEEDPDLIGNSGINSGEVARKLGLEGAPALAEEVLVARDCLLALRTGAKINIQHVSSEVSSWALDIQSNLSKEELGFEKETKIGQRVSLAVGIFSIVVAMVLANGGVKSAYEWFNGFMGLVLGILIGTFILGAFTKVANTFGATAAFIAASAVMVYIKYFVPAGQVTIWSYSIISIAVSLVVGIPASIIWRNIKGDKSEPAPNTTIYKN